MRLKLFFLIFFSILFIPVTVQGFGDNFLNTFGETCSVSSTSFSDIQSIAFSTCGNGICEDGEDRCTCANDCGECTGAVPNELCEQYTCQTGLCRATTVFQCCGNEICEAGENYSTCSRDCAPRDLEIELVDFDSSAVFMRGDEVIVKAIVRGDGALVKDATVTLNGFMGAVVMNDNGENGDLQANNGIYTVVFEVPENAEKDMHSVKILAIKSGAIEQIDFLMNINPSLELSANFNKEQFRLGDIVDVNGFIKKNGEGFETRINFFAELNGVKVFSESVDSNTNGFFSVSYHTSLIEGKGNWHFFVEGKDEFNNIGLVEEPLLVTDAFGTAFLDIGFVSPIEKVFERRDSVRIIVEVSFDNEPVNDAVVVAAFLNNDVVKLSPFSVGKYSGNYVIPDNFSLGEQEIIINATKKVDSISYTGTNSKQILIKVVPINIEMISPDRAIFGLGETIDFKFKLSYSSSDPVIGANVNLKVNDSSVQITELSEGIYGGSYTLLDVSIEDTLVSIDAMDVFSNAGNKVIVFQVQQSLSPDYYFRRYPLPFLSGIVIIIALIVIFFLIRRKKLMIGSLDKRRLELLKLKKELQDKYFNKQSISNEEYYFLLEKYSTEIRALDSAITAFSEKQKVKGKDSKKKKPIETSVDDKPLVLFKVVKPSGKKEKKERKK